MMTLSQLVESLRVGRAKTRFVEDPEVKRKFEVEQQVGSFYNIYCIFFYNFNSEGSLLNALN